MKVDPWGWLGMAIAPLALALACGGKHSFQAVGDVGDAGEPNGSGLDGKAGNHNETGGSGGSGATLGHEGGKPSVPEATGGVPFEVRCFEARGPTDKLDNDVGPGPRNQAFGEVQYEDDPINYAEQVVISGPTWRFNANYPASAHADDTTLDLPGSLASHAPNVGELRLAVPLCESFPVAGRTIRVEVWWKPTSDDELPTHGLALGAGEEPTWFDVGSKKFVVGQPENERVMNTLEAVTIEHTFEDDDQTTATEVFLAAWVLADLEFPTILYVGSVEWE